MKDFIVISGASGNVGRQVAKRLLGAGQAIRVVARTAEKLKPLGDLGAEISPGSLDDRAFLTDALRGARAAFVICPVNTSAKDVNAEQKKNVESIGAAIRGSGVKHVVAVSSWGLERPEKIGAMIGCYWLEKEIDAISGLNVVHLRPVWFMENFLWNIGLIKMAGINGLSIKAHLPMPMIASSDVAAVAADYLTGLGFKGRSIHELNGPRDYTTIELTSALGASIGKPHLGYVEFPEGIFRKGLISNGGLSPNAADMLIEINRAINSGRVKAGPRSKSNTTPTTLEEFATNVFAPAFKAAPDPSLSDRLGGLMLRSLLLATGRRAKALAHAHTN